MYNKHIEIKERAKGFFAKGFFFLALMVLSLLYAFYPILSSKSLNGAIYYYLLGGVAFVAFLGFFSYLIYKEFKPDNAMVLNARSFIDFVNVGKDIDIEWTNVSSVKIMGKDESPFLGISLENTDIIMTNMSKSRSEIMRENIEEGLPAILISQNDVRMPVSELKDIFSRFVREARFLEKDIAKKQKNNPFSTDDVLRAFGHTAENDQTVYENEDTYTNELTKAPEEVVNSIDNTKSALTDEQVQDTNADEPTSYEHIDDATISPKNDISEEFPEEINELLSRAKSSKINELEKMLSDSQSYDNVSTIESTLDLTDAEVEETAEEITSDETQDIDNEVEIPESKESVPIIEEVVSDNKNEENTDESNRDMQIEFSTQQSDFVKTNEPEISFPEEFYLNNDAKKDTQELKFERNLETMLSNAFVSESSSNNTNNIKNEEHFAKPIVITDEESETHNSDDGDDFSIEDMGFITGID